MKTDRFTFQSIRIPGAIEPFVMLQNYRHALGKSWQWFENAIANQDVFLHLRQLDLSQLSWFVQNLLWNSEFAYVMQKTTTVQDLQVALWQAYFLSDPESKAGDAFRMPRGPG